MFEPHSAHPQRYNRGGCARQVRAVLCWLSSKGRFEKSFSKQKREKKKERKKEEEENSFTSSLYSTHLPSASALASRDSQVLRTVDDTLSDGCAWGPRAAIIGEAERSRAGCGWARLGADLI